MSKTQKLVALDGIRGLASLVVVCHHLVLMLCPAIKNQKHISFVGHLLADSPLRLFHDGTFAVRIFFVLSGVVLSLGFFKRRDLFALSSAACRRYPRLALPVAASVLFVYLLMANGCIFNGAVSDLLHRQANDWMRGLNQFEPSVKTALTEAFVSPFLGYGEGDRYNPVLWTMTVEFRGSLLVYALLALVGSLRKRWLFYSVVALGLGLLGHAYVVDFVVGVAIADLYAHVSRRRPGWQLGSLATWALVGMGTVAATLRPVILEEFGLGHLAFAKIYWHTLGAACLILATLFSPTVRRFLEFRPVAWLGKVSFSLYLFHLPIMLSLGSWALIELLTVYQFGYFSASVLVAVLCTTASLAVAHLMAATVERWSIVWPQRMFDKYFNPQPSALHAQSPLPSATREAVFTPEHAASPA